jgi:hypothetical protein
MLNHSVAMASEKFKATRLSWASLLFPVRIEITDKQIICVKWHWLWRRKSTVNIDNIASIHIRNMRFTSEILFKNLNGGVPLKIVGMNKSDARRIRHLVEKALGV